MPLALLVFTTILAHTAFNGARLTISLEALALGASPLTVGGLMSLIAALPMVMGIHLGRLVDRIGVRRPLTGAVVLVILAIVSAAIFSGMAALPFVGAAVGSGFALFHICVQHMVGEMSSAQERRDNFSLLALGFGVSNFLGPTISGFSIDHFGHRVTFGILSVFACLALAVVLLRRSHLPHTPHHERNVEERSALELLRNRELRRVFLVTGLLATAWDLFAFLMPIYGTSIGLSATTIGLILGCFAAAAFAVRLMLPWIQRRLHEWALITATFGVGCVAYAIFPIVKTVPLLAAMAFLLGFGLGAAQPSIMALLYLKAPEGRSGEAVGVRAVILNVSHTVLPLAFGGLGAALGMLPVFWAMSGLLAGGAVFANRRRMAERSG